MDPDLVDTITRDDAGSMLSVTFDMVSGSVVSRTMNSILFNPNDLEKMQINSGDKIKLSSRRGTVECFARVDDGVSEGQVFMPFCYHEAAANLLTNDALDPFAKIPEFKFCALKVKKLPTHR